MLMMQPGQSIEETSSKDMVYFLYRYRPFRDDFDSLRRILSENLWWFGSRTGFDDELDSVLGESGTIIALINFVPRTVEFLYRCSFGQGAIIVHPASPFSNDYFALQRPVAAWRSLMT